MERLIDEIVEVKVSDISAAAASTSVNTVAVLGKASQALVKVEYKKKGESDSVIADFGTSSDLTKIASTFFDEKENPHKLVCIGVTEDITGENIEETLESALAMGKDANYHDIDFYHVVLRISDDIKSDDGSVTKAKSIVDALDSWCRENSKIAHLEVNSPTSAKALINALSAKKPSRVWIYSHNETSGASLPAALTANRCANDPARGTWAHKNLSSIESDSVSKQDIKDANEMGFSVFAKVANVNRCFFTSGVGGGNYVDEQVKKDWLKFRTQEAIFNLLGDANNGDGADFGDAGIGSVAAAINNIFTIASDNDHRYVMPDSFDVLTPKYADISAEDKKARNLPDIRVTFAIQSSIHTVKYVELQVVA